MKEEGRKTPSFEFNLLDLISFYDENDRLKVDYSLLNKKLDNIESIISTFITSCFISSYITSMFVNIVVKYINDSLAIYGDEREAKDKMSLISYLLLCSSNGNENKNSNLIYKCVESQEQYNQVDVNGNSLDNQDNHQEGSNDNNNYSNNENNNGGNGEMNNSNGNDNNGNNNNNNNDRNEDNDDTKDNSKNKKSNKKKENKNKKEVTEDDEEDNNEVKTENSLAVENNLTFEPLANEGINQFMNQNKEFSKSIIPSLYHRSSTGSLKKSKLLGAIGSKDDSIQFLGKDNDFIGGNHIDNKNVHLIHELSNNNINKMPSIIEDRTEEGGDIDDMKMILKKDQGKKKGDKLSKLLISKPGEGALDESKKEEGGYTSLAYSPFSNNFELWKNNIVESLPYRSSASGLGSHRNSICCPYDIITNFCTSNNVRRGSLPALNYSYQNNSNLTTSNDIATPPQSSCVSSANSLSYSSTSSSTSSSLSSPSSNSTMVNQSNNNEGHPYSFNKLNFNNSKAQKSGSTQISSTSTPSTKISEISKDAKNEVDNSAYTTPVGNSKLTHSASFSGTFNNYTLSSSSSCNSLSAIANTLNNSSSSSTLNFIDNSNGGKNGSTPGGLKQSMSNGDFSNFSSMVTGSIETATKISCENKSKSDMDSSSIQNLDAIDKLNGKGNSNNGGNNDDGKKSIGGSSCDTLKNLSNDNGNVSLATSIFDEDRTSFTSYYDKDSISTDNGLGFYNYPNIFSRGRSFSISVDSLFVDPNSNDHEFEGDSFDTFDTFGSNDLGHIKSVNSLQFRYNTSSRRQSCPLISSYSDYSLSKKKSMDEMSNLGSMALDSLDEISETKSIDRARKGSTATLNDFTSTSSTLFKEDSFLSSLNYSITNDTSFQSKKGSDSEFNSLLSSKSSLNLSSSGLNEGINDSNSMTSSFSNTVSFLSTANANGSEKSNFPYRKTRSYSMSSVSYPFSYSSLFNSENENQEGLASLTSSGNKNKSSVGAKMEKSFTTTKGAITDVKNPWLSSDSKSKSSSNLFKLNTFTENPDYDFGFNLGWKTDKKLPNSKLNTDLYNISEGQASSINGITSKSLSNLKSNTTPATTGNNSNSSLNTIPNSNSNDMLFNGNKISTTANLDDKSNEGHGKTKKKLLGWGFLAKYNFIDFDDDAYQEDKKTNTTNNNIMKNRQNNNMPYASNSSYSIYGNGSINPSMINANPYMPQTSYNGPGYNNNMMNKMNYMNNGNAKGSNGAVIYNGKNNTNANTNTLSYQQKNGMVYYNNDGNGVPLTNNFNSNNNSTSGTGPNTTNANTKNHPVYHPNSKKSNAKIINNYNNYYQNPGMVSRNIYNENTNMNNGGNRYKYNGYKNGNTNNPTINPLNKMINTNGIKTDNTLNPNGVNEGKNDIKVNNTYPNNTTNNNKNNVGGTKKKVKSSNPNNNANANNPNNSASATHDPNAKLNSTNANTNNTKTTTTTKSKKKNRNNASKNKNNNNNNNTTVNDTNIEANIATILSSINGENNNVNENKINTSVTKNKKNNSNKANANKNNTNNSSSSKDNNETSTSSGSISEQFNLNIAEFIPGGNNNNSKKVNEKNKEAEISNEDSTTNLNNEIFNTSFHPAKNATAPFIESSVYNNKEN